MVRKVRIKDRREHPRYLVGLPVEMRRERSPAPGLEAGIFEGQCIDISRGGMRVGTRELFHPREKLEVTVFSAGGQAEMRCEVEVVRSVRVPRRYEVAAKITRLLSIDIVEGAPTDVSRHA